MAYKPTQKTTKLVGKKSKSGPTMRKRGAGTGASPKSHNAIGGTVPKGGTKGLPVVPNSRVR
jgi:hypothetical protein